MIPPTADNASLSGEIVAPDDAKVSARVRVWRWVRVLLSVLLIGYVLQQADWTTALKQIKHFDPIFLLVFMLVGPLNMSVCVLKWQRLLRARGVMSRFGMLFGLYIYGQFYHNILPTSVGGDVVRTVMLRNRIGSMNEAATSIAAERLTGLAVVIVMETIRVRVAN